tara:strand:+ start:2218 stop:3687 length:1470 start_codon:yes stop_codon:yes gene_type:complete
MATEFFLWCGPVSVVLGVGFAVAALLDTDQVSRIIYGTLSLLAFLLRTRLAFNGARARLLTGNNPLESSHAPTNPTEFVALLQEIWDKAYTRPTIVGAGWGFFIGRRCARNAVFTHRMTGRCPDEQNAWFAGTTIKTVSTSILKHDKRTFWSTPTMQHISIGSWICRSCHGNAGAGGKPSSHAVAILHYVHIATRETTLSGMQSHNYAMIKDEIDAHPDHYAIVAITFELKRMTPNIKLQKNLCKITADTSGVCNGLQKWLTDDAILRVLFFGSAREIGLGMMYTEADMTKAPTMRSILCGLCKVEHVDPHCLSAECMSMQLDTCSYLGGWYEKSKDAWHGRILLSDANAFSPNPGTILLLPLVTILSPFKNFEFIFNLRKKIEASDKRVQVQHLCNTLLGLFTGPSKLKGRSDLRIGNLESGTMFVDCIMDVTDTPILIKALAQHVHGNVIALHDSKFRSATLQSHILAAKLSLTTPRVIYNAFQTTV